MGKYFKRRRMLSVLRGPSNSLLLHKYIHTTYLIKLYRDAVGKSIRVQNVEYKIVGKMSCKKDLQKCMFKVRRGRSLFIFKYWEAYDNLFEEDFQRHVQVYQTMKDHQTPHILFPIHWGKTTKGAFMVFPFIEEIKERDELSWEAISQIAEAIEGVHLCNIIHTDIKASNVLFAKDGNIYVIDFEDAFFGPVGEYPQEVGTLPYLSPEVALNLEGSNTFPRDVWAFGVLIYYLVFKFYPFPHEIDPDDDDDRYDPRDEYEMMLYKNILVLVPYYIENETNLSFASFRLILYLTFKIWIMDPKLRPTMTEVRRYIKHLKEFQSTLKPRARARDIGLSFEMFKNI
eukprot:TRINITY_DN8666_c0_g1_i1.p1 TRINITY_DN8666_c0_g1~~TRINITY_DN8666_c0_g1_i1.p1  ORF type:complete len:343 (+),score=32.10 TRINITY_DN8666_c0_g1_i1:113-1141(+)